MKSHTGSKSTLVAAVNDSSNDWYVVDDPCNKVYVGPMSLKTMANRVEKGELDLKKAFAFKQGDSQMTPISQLFRKSA